MVFAYRYLLPSVRGTRLPWSRAPPCRKAEFVCPCPRPWRPSHHRRSSSCRRLSLRRRSPRPRDRAHVDPVEAALLERVRRSIRTLHYSRRTERAYSYWVGRFVAHYGARDPARMSVDEIRGFLSHLALAEGVGASTQKPGLVRPPFPVPPRLGKDLGLIKDIERARDEAPAGGPHASGGEGRSRRSSTACRQLACRLLSEPPAPVGVPVVASAPSRPENEPAERPRRQGDKGPSSQSFLSCRRGLLQHLKGAPRHAQDLQGGLGRAPLPFALADSTPGQTASGAGSTCSRRSRTTPTSTVGGAHRHHLLRHSLSASAPAGFGLRHTHVPGAARP